jgi:uncharacterized protein (DUF1015 family)
MRGRQEARPDPGFVCKKLLDDIKVNGIKEPIKYVEELGGKHIVDGHHRTRAAKSLGLETVPAQKVTLPYSGYKTTADLIWTPF